MGYDIIGATLRSPQILSATYYDDYSFLPDTLAARFAHRPRDGFAEPWPSARGLATGCLPYFLPAWKRRYILH